MTVLVEVPKSAEEVPRFLIGAAQRIQTRNQKSQKSVWGYLNNDVQCGLFVTDCKLDVDDAHRIVFTVDGLTHDQQPVNWTECISEIDVARQKDNGIALNTGRGVPLTLYLF